MSEVCDRDYALVASESVAVVKPAKNDGRSTRGVILPQMPCLIAPFSKRIPYTSCCSSDPGFALFYSLPTIRLLRDDGWESRIHVLAQYPPIEVDRFAGSV